MAIARAAGMAGISLDKAAEAAALSRFYPVYAEASSKGRGLFPDAIELLRQLTEAGVPLGLCTNKAEPITKIAIEALGISSYFRSVIGARDDLPKKPDPAMLLAALAPLGAAPRDALMIGDSSADIGAAKAAGCPIIALAHGYARVPVAELGADAVAPDLAALPEVIAALTHTRSRERT
ncbi:MAG: HAD-IA family hydrolase [Proteobacteria bacterium]|nr:HAD-IA family hydrolase [Pseudomonadota bacterium]